MLLFVFMQACFTTGGAFLKVHIPERYLFHTTMVLGVAIVCLLLFILIYLLRFIRFTKKSSYLANHYSNLISEITICESEEELLHTVDQFCRQTNIRKWLTKPLGKTMLMKGLMNMRKGMAGAAADNIVWLYTYFEMDKYSLERLSSTHWHIKASAIQELAEMGQQQLITKIYRETNHKNIYVRTEAQVAVVKLTGFDGLRFLNLVGHTITQWQQLCLLQQLPAQDDFEWSKVPVWLQSQNDSVVEFALKLIEKYSRFDLHDVAAACLQHHSPVVKKQTLKTLKEINQEPTASMLEQYFPNCTPEVQLTILEVMVSIAAKEQLSFLTQVWRSTHDDAIKHAALKVIVHIYAAWPGMEENASSLAALAANMENLKEELV